MNIAICHYSCPPVVGGVEIIVGQQADLFKKYHHNVKVLAGSGGQFSPYIDIEINPMLSSTSPRIIELHEALKETRSLKIIEPDIRKAVEFLEVSLRSFDVLIAHNILTMPYNLPLTYAIHRIAARGGIKVISWNHDSPYFYEGYPGYIDEGPWLILKKRSPDICYVCISESRRSDFGRLYGSDDGLHVIPNGIFPSDFLQLGPMAVRLIKDKGLLDADLIMIQPSRLHPRKNIELSIGVIKAIKKRGINAILLLSAAHDPHEISFVEYYRRLKDLSIQEGVADNIIFMTEYISEDHHHLALDRSIIKDLYLISDILFMPSTQEGFGIPILEAGILRLPIVCSNIAPFKEICNHDACMFDLKDTPEEIADKIIEFGKSNVLGMYRKVLRGYNWDSIYRKRLLPLLERLTISD
ncbi:MAG: glycosyltransferase family 4 protein [Thermodesulfobacteriota bacterium]|nr:glycosyltransferase family 4 protein [Thermodesulfobacteriota bacterium]